MKQSRKPMPPCPVHGCAFEKRIGRFGFFYGCPMYPNCDRIARRSQYTGEWSVSDQSIRDARKKAHAAFDGIWQDKRLSRNKAYLSLAALMKLHPKHCHIEHFDVAQCEKVVRLVCDGAIERQEAEYRAKKEQVSP